MDSAPQHTDSAPIPIQTPPGMSRWLGRRLSEESIRTELCEGPVPDSPPLPATPQQAVSHAVSDRAELIERLKRGESPTWIPNRHVRSAFPSRSVHMELTGEQLESLFHHGTSPPPRTPQPAGPAGPVAAGLLPAPTITPVKEDTSSDPLAAGSPMQEGLSIERPRSALHSGNFTPVELSPRAANPDDAFRRGGDALSRAGHTGWMSTSPPRDYAAFYVPQDTYATRYRTEAFGTSGPSSLSSSLSSNFVYQPPTSPLVQSESNDELDLTGPLGSFNIDASGPRNSRRHTLNFAHSHIGHKQSPLRRESVYPYQAHQPRRSLHSTSSLLPGTLPQTPGFLRSRRPSLSSEASPLQHASMVGSYEESILRGRMSTTPSKPLDFMAQIGVLGLGKCKSSLRCPAHVTLPFSAVFYSYPSTSNGAEDGPSPYVGQIDLENGLPNPDEGQRVKRKLQSRYQERKAVSEGEPRAQETATELSDGDGAFKASRQKRPSKSVKAPPGGSYRIPEKGQLQVIIKNQNKTAVKLFLVPYDLAGMEPGTKTFIRQRSYSAGPIIETNIPAAKAEPANADRPTLRYLIHIHICCPSKGRFYLYRSIRVVFANRVPDGKERLRNEVTYPEPRFTAYKPIRVMQPPLGAVSHSNTISVSPSAALAAERSFRRRSAGFFLGSQHSLPYHHYHQHHYHYQQHHQVPPFDMSELEQTPTAHPSSFATRNRRAELTEIFPSSETGFRAVTPMSGLEMTGPSSIPAAGVSPSLASAQPQDPTPAIAAAAAAATAGTYDKLSKGDFAFGFSHGGANTVPVVAAQHSAAATEGLLSQGLRSLGAAASHAPTPTLSEEMKGRADQPS